jgi:hypothetical protein
MARIKSASVASERARRRGPVLEDSGAEVSGTRLKVCGVGSSSVSELTVTRRAEVGIEPFGL